MSFWNVGFVIIVLIPFALVTAAYTIGGRYDYALFQTALLAVLCWNNRLLCINHELKEELLEDAQINLALIEYIKEKIEGVKK